MADCKVLNRTNGEESNLYDQLLSVTGDESVAKDAHAYIHTDEFIDIFGDFIRNPESMRDRIDDNGEPKLFYNSKVNKYFIIDKENEPVFFPYDQLGLKQFFSSNEISDFAKSLAFSYYDSELSFSKESGEILNISDFTLLEHVKEFIHIKKHQLNRNDDFESLSLALALENSLEHADEWVEEVRNFFKSIKIDNSLEEKQDFVDNEESLNDEIIRKESFLKNSKDSVNNNVKLYLSLIPSTVKNSFNEDTFIGFDEIYTVLNNALRDIQPVHNEQGELEDEFDIYLENIKQLIPFKPYLQKVYDDLTASDISENYKNQFTQAFRLVKNNFLGSELTIELDKNGDRKVSYTVRNLSEVSARKNNIIQQWKFNFDVLDSNASKIKRYISTFRSEVDKISKNVNKIDEKSFNNYKAELQRLLKKVGVYTTEKGIDYYLNNGKAENIALDERIQTLINTFDAAARELENVIDKESDDEVFNNQSVFKDLAGAEAFFIEEGSDATIFSVGKTKWVYSKSSFLGKQLNKWKKDPGLLIKQYEATEYNKKSLWLSYLTAEEYANDYNQRIEESRKRLEVVTLNIFNSVQTKGDSVDAVDNKDITDTDALNDYVHKLLGGRYNNGKTYHKTALAADKNTEYQLFLGNDPNYFNIDTNAYVENSNIKVSNRVLEIFYDYFVGEYNRMKYEHEFVSLEGNKNKLKQNYHLGNRNAFKSQLFPSMSINFDEDGNAIQPDLDFDLYDKNGIPLYDDLNEVKDKIKQKIQQALSARIKTTYDTLFDYQLVKFDKDGRLINNAIDSTLFEMLKKDATNSEAVVNLAADTTINSIISQIEFSKMFTGDIAYYKNLDDYLKRVPETYTDGQALRLKTGEEYFNIGVIDSVEVSPDSLEEMKKYLPEEIWRKYEKKVNSTDAQAWITPERWKFLMERIGKPQELIDKVYEKMHQSNPTFEKNELKLLSTILKGVHYELSEDNVPIFLKYSQSVLIPSAIKNTGLEKLYNKMKSSSNPIDELITIDGVKVGSFKPVVAHNENGDVLDDFELNSMQLRNEYWKLQQDLPVKGSKNTDVGSQIQKIAFSGLKSNRDRSFQLGDGTLLSGDDMITYLNSIISAMSYSGLKDVVKDLGIEVTDENNRFKIKDESKMFDMIIEQMKSRKETTGNFIKALEARTSPYGIPGAKTMFHNIFNAYITDKIVKVKTNGGGFIQMSDFGLSYDEITKKNSGIKLTPWFINSTDKKLHTPKVVGINEKTGKKIIQPGGCFISGSIISKYIPNWQQFSTDELFGTLNEETGKYEGGMIDQEILTNIISYRIPTQGLGSADALMIMGILPNVSADTIIPYTGITTKTGSDFDIDKMYLMIPSFKPSYNTNFKEVYDFIKDEFHAGNVKDSILKIQNFIKDLELDESELKRNGFDINEFYKNINSREYLSETISKSDRALMMALLNDANKEHPTVKKMYKTYDIKVTSLNYIDPRADYRDPDLMTTLPIEVLQNKLIDVYKTILTDQNVIESVMNPIDLPFIANDVKNLNGVELTEDLAGFDGISQLKTKFEFLKGKAGLGQNVNSLVDSIRGAMANLHLIDYYLGQGHFDKNGKENAFQTIFDSEYSKELTPAEQESYVKSYNKREKDPSKHITIEDVKKLASIKLDDSMTALVNAFVDIVKDSFIVKGNWTTQTNNIGFMMLRAGIHPFITNAFLSQPVLKSYVKFVTNMESNAIDSTNKILQEFKLKFILDNIDPSDKYEFDLDTEVKSKTKKELFKRLFTLENIKFFDDPANPSYEKNKEKFVQSMLPNKIGELLGLPKNKKNLYSKDLFEQLQGASYDLINEFEKVFELKSDKEFKDFSLTDLRNEIEDPNPENQTALLKIFLNFQEAAKSLTKNIKASKIDVDGPGKDINSLFISLNIIDELLNNQEQGLVGGFDTKMDYNGTPTMLSSIIDNSLKFTYQVMKANPKFFLTADDKILSTFNEVSNFIYGNNLQGDKLASKLESGYYTYLMSGFKPLQMSQDERRDLLIETPGKLRGMARRYPKNKLLQDLYERKGDSLKLGRTEEEMKDKKFYKKFYISFPNLKSSKSVKDNIVDAWSDLFVNEPKFAEDLIKYCYITTGFNNNINAFQQYIPYEWFNKNRFNAYLKNSRKGAEVIDMNFIDQFFRNSHEDKAITKKVYLTAENFIEGIHSKTAFSSTENKGYLVKTERKGDDVNETIYSNYYRLHGVDPEGNFIYLRTSPLGNKDAQGNRIFEYDINEKNLLTNVSNKKLNLKKINIEHYAAIINDPDINIINTAKSEVTEDTFDLEDANDNINKTFKVEEDQPKVEKEYNLQSLFTDSGFIKTAKGHISLSGSKYRIKDANHEIVNDEGVDSLILYPAGDKTKGYTIGTRPEGTEEFELIDSFKQKETAQTPVNIKSSGTVYVKSEKIITRTEVKSNPKTLYLFGDNDQRKGLGGQAKEMRGEVNTVGVSTKKYPSNAESSFKTDSELEENKKIITEDINKVIAEWNTGKYNKVSVPQIGVGLAALPTRAPQTYAFLQKELNRLEQAVSKPEIKSEFNKLTLEELREAEQKEILSKIPNIENYKVDGMIDKTLMPTPILNKYDEIWKKYDGLIMSLAQPETQNIEEGEQLSLFEPLTSEEMEELEKIKNYCKPKK